MSCPLTDTGRPAILWLAVLVLLLIRKTNRIRAAWTILIPLLGAGLILIVAEQWINSYLIFHLHQYICSIICDSLGFFALGIAILLLVSDLIHLQNRVIRFLLVFLILAISGVLATHLSRTVILSAACWPILFVIGLFLFLLGHGIVSAIVRRLAGQKQFFWMLILCLLIGAGPLLTALILDWRLDSPRMSRSLSDMIRVAAVLSGALLAPWLVFFWFVLLARLSGFYRERFVRCFRYRIT